MRPSLDIKTSRPYNTGVKQNASLDASFWINSCNADVVNYLSDFFNLFICQPVVEEIRYPLTRLGIEANSQSLLDERIQSGQVTVQNPEQPVAWFQRGENAAIALAVEQGHVLLIDDANPFHFAKSKGLRVIGTLDFLVFLYDQSRLSHAETAAAIARVRASKKQIRQALIALEILARERGDKPNVEK